MNNLIKHIVKMLVLLLDVDSGPLDETEAQDEVMMQNSSRGCSVSWVSLAVNSFTAAMISRLLQIDRTKINHQLF